MLELPWGDEQLQVPIPAGWRMLGPYLPSSVDPPAEPAELCQAALAKPIGAAPLAERALHGKRVLIVSDDVSRPTPVARFFRAVGAALVRAGAELSSIEILFALGVHRPMSATEAEAKIGRHNLAAHRWHNHDAYDDAGLVHLGTTSRGTPVALNRLLTQFDLIVLQGTIEPHLLLGFGGGLKMLLPGCAGAATIGRNHLQGVADGRFNYVGTPPDSSPMRLDLEEGAALLGKDVFLVNCVLNARGEIVRFFCGDARTAFRTGVEFVRQHSEAALPEPADVVITNSRPFDADLRQGPKCIGNTLYAARPGGVMLGLLRCSEGRGDLDLPSWTLPYPLLRCMVRLAGRRRILNLLNLFRPGDPIEQRFLTHFGLQMLRRNHIWFFSPNVEPDTGKKLGALRQYASLEQMLAAAVRRVGAQATCAVFPLGGVTYCPRPCTAGK